MGPRRCHAGRRDESGSTAVEFAFVLIFVLLPVLFGIIEFGRAYEAKVQLTGAVREGARMLALNPSATVSQVEARIVSAAPGLDPAPTVLAMTPCNLADEARVTARYQQPFLTPLIPGSGWDFRVEGVMRCGL